MIYIQNIPHLKVYRQKVYLPINEKATTLYNTVFLNSKDVNSSINFMKHPLISSNNKYLTYYIESVYREKIGIKSVIMNYRQRRTEIYKAIDSNFNLLYTPLEFNQIRNRNLFYDMHIYNELFISNTKSQPIMKKISMYIDYIKNIFNNKNFDRYNKIMSIGIEDWSNDIINNPVMYLFLAFRKDINKFKELGNMNIIFYTKNEILRVNPSLCDRSSFNIFKTRLNYLYKQIDLDNEESVNNAILRQELKDNLSKSLSDKYSFTGDDVEELIDEELDYEDIEDPILSSKKDIKEEDKEVDEKQIEDKIVSKINNDEALLKDMATTVKSKMVGKSTASLKRDEEIRKKQRAIKFKNITIEDVKKIKNKDTTIDTNDISKSIKSTNKNISKVQFTNFEKAYNEKLMAKDTLSIFSNLNNMSIPTYITNIDVEDTSDELNYKETYSITLEDENRVRHTFKVDMPKFIEDKFLYLNGNKKIIMKQLYMKPIVKTGPDEVQICSNYNKIFIERYGSKLSSKTEKMKKVLANDISGLKALSGDNSEVNNKYKTILEYDELAKNYSYIKSGKIEFLFNQDEIHSRLNNYKLKDNEFCIGFNNGKPMIVDYTTEKIDNLDIIDYIRTVLNDKIGTLYDNTTSGSKRFAYTRATIMSKHVPIILLTGYCEGLTTVLRKGNINHYFSDKRVDETDEKGVIRFNDGYLVYDKYPYENSLLLNGLASIPTRSFSYSDFDNKEIYIELFDIMFNARNLGNAFDSFYEFMIDPITKEVLEDLDYPTDFVSVLLVGNALLADNSYITETNMNLYRIRSNEIVNGMLHRHLADAYAKYRATANNKNPVKISIPRDAVIKQLQKAETVEEFSTLNPIYEVEKTRAASTKGLNGMNLKEAYTIDKRAYHETMLGIIGMSSKADANVGVVRQLTLEPNVLNARGYIDINDNLDELKDVNLFTTGEFMTPLGALHDDPPRTNMASTQSRHIIPIENASPVLISNGGEQAIQYNLSKDFIIKAEDDGKVIEIDEKVGYVIVKYNNGNTQAIDIKPRIVKNSASGFYISNKLNCDLKLNQKVKKNDILGYENKFFTNDELNGNRFNIGSLQKMAIMNSYSTFEDSSLITQKMSKEMKSEIVMMKDVIIGKNANVDKIVKIGDKVKVGDTLITFETSYNEDELNKFLASVGDELHEEIKSLNRIPIKSKYTGEIVDIKLYSSVDEEELSPTLRKIVSDYYAITRKKKKLLEKHDKNKGIIKSGVLFNEATGKMEPTQDGKIKGKEVFEGVLIEFYIKYNDYMGVGDKITFFSALKSVIGELIEEGYEPYSEFRPEEEVSSFLSSGSVLKRMTPSIILTMFGNKVLVELKRKLEEIYNSK